MTGSIPQSKAKAWAIIDIKQPPNESLEGARGAGAVSAMRWIHRARRLRAAARTVSAPPAPQVWIAALPCAASSGRCMLPSGSVLGILVKLVDGVPMPPAPTKRGRGHPQVYSDRLFLKALAIMIVRQ